jgi:hypothetical protein
MIQQQSPLKSLGGLERQPSRHRETMSCRCSANILQFMCQFTPCRDQCVQLGRIVLVLSCHLVIQFLRAQIIALHSHCVHSFRRALLHLWPPTWYGCFHVEINAKRALDINTSPLSSSLHLTSFVWSHPITISRPSLDLIKATPF